MFNLDNKKSSLVHFIGIGGISMSGLALILLDKGYNVSGSDMKSSSIIEDLKKKGAHIYIGHNSSNIKNPDLIVYTSAISEDNPEYLEALERNITIVDRATFLGQIMKEFNNSIAISGTHGKTSTTGMISTILNESTLDPTILLGGELSNIGGNVKIGSNDLLITEACEYKGNFLKFHPTIGIILNIDEDHLDYFKDITHIIDTFVDFGNLIPKNGYLIVNNDDDNIGRIINSNDCNLITFGINNDSNFKAVNIKFDDVGFPYYDLVIDNNKTYNVKLNVVGTHNVYNSLAAIASSNKAGLPIEECIEYIKEFKGTNRRYQYKGIFNDIRIIDDYAHHPTEIKATLNSAKKYSKGKIWCVFQPHTYTRTKALLNEFSNSFYDADKVIITDIYAAREKDTGLVHSRDLADKLKENGVDVVYLNDFNEISHYIIDNTNKNDIVITMGAGDIYEVGEILLKKYR